MTAGGASDWLAEIDAWGKEREALVADGRSYSFEEVAGRVRCLVVELEANDVKPGDFVGLFSPPSEAGFILIHALLARRIVMVPLNLRLTPSELRFAIESVQLRWLVVSPETSETTASVATQVGTGLLVLDSDSESKQTLTRQRAPTADLSNFSAGRRRGMLARDAALVLFTSGTSGRPKGALLSAANLRSSARASIEMSGTDITDRWLCCMPLFHIGGLSILIRSVIAGTAVVLHARFDADVVCEALEQDRITRVSLVATMLSAILEVRGERPAPVDLKLVLLGGGPAPRETLLQAIRLGYPIAPTYGLTEAASQVATRPPNRVLEPDADPSGGLEPLPGTEIRIAVVDSDSDEGQSTLGERVGEIEVRGPTIMLGYLGYLGDAAAPSEAFREGWLATGDIGRIDSSGRLRVLDRRSDLIVSGGENVYPAEIESILVEHDDVAEAGVVGRPDPRFGERPVAYVVAVSGRRVDPAGLLDHCRGRLARYKLPSDVIVVEALPRTPSGKLLRREIASWANRTSGTIGVEDEPHA